jgi:hypothetical protein
MHHNELHSFNNVLDRFWKRFEEQAGGDVAKKALL